jgi:putative transposase
MKGKRFKEEQIIRILQEAETGLSVADICRKHNCSEQSFYRWKAKFGGMDVSETKRLKELERENAELKKIVAEQTLDIRMLKDVNSRKW